MSYRELSNLSFIIILLEMVSWLKLVSEMCDSQTQSRSDTSLVLIMASHHERESRALDLIYETSCWALTNLKAHFCLLSPTWCDAAPPYCGPPFCGALKLSKRPFISMQEEKSTQTLLELSGPPTSTSTREKSLTISFGFSTQTIGVFIDRIDMNQVIPGLT